MEKLIEHSQESLITCDNKACDYTIPYNKGEETDTIKYINMPCPKCGENLLTREDYLQHKKIIGVVNFINKWFSWITIFYSKETLNKRKSTFSVHVHNGVKVEEVKKCTKDLYKSTYKENAFDKDKEYRVSSSDKEFVWLIDNKGYPFNLSKEPTHDYYYINDYFDF
jgi:hypothetical protein